MTVAEYLRDLRSRAPADDAFTLAVAANACRVVARELPPDDPAPRERAAQLAAALRAGEHDAGLDALVDPLRAEVRAKLEVANPRWIGVARLGASALGGCSLSRCASWVACCLRRWSVMRSVENPALRRSASRSRSRFEGGGGGVELAAVEFDDESLSAVDGVDFVAGDVLVELGEREVVAFEEADEAVFEVGAGGALLGCEVCGAAARIAGGEGGQARWR